MGIKTPTLADTIVSNKGRYYGAGDRTRTGTSVTSRDFKSLVSTYSTTPAAGRYGIIFFPLRQVNIEHSMCLKYDLWS